MEIKANSAHIDRVSPGNIHKLRYVITDQINCQYKLFEARTLLKWSILANFKNQYANMGRN